MARLGTCLVLRNLAACLSWILATVTISAMLYV